MTQSAITVLVRMQGSCQVNDSIELPALKLSRPIKSIHMFHKPVQSIQRGDRAGICVTQLNPKLVERGLAAAPGSVPTFSAAIAAVDKVRFYAGAVPSKQKYHVIVGHDTVMAEATFFGLPDGQGMPQAGVETGLLWCDHIVAVGVGRRGSFCSSCVHVQACAGAP